MAKAMSATQFASQMAKWKIDFAPYKSGWARHNRGNRGSGWGEYMHGIMLHHTGPYSSNKQMLELLWDGYSSLPGPLCNVGLDTSGKLWGIGWGRANHAGSGDDEVLRNIIAEDYGDRPGYGDKFEANTDGNARFYGIEVIHSGSHTMLKQQYVTMVLFAAAICDWHGWKAKSVLNHGEWQPGKWDPGYSKGKMMPGKEIREHIADALKAGPGNWPTKTDPEPEPEPQPEPEDKTSHVIKKDDTLWALADNYLGSGKRWPELVQANIHLFPLPIGKTLKIPE